jgi:ribosome maturation factor RimP
MVDKGTIETIVKEQLNPENEFIVEINISSGNKILVHIDSDLGITIDRCVQVSKTIEQSLDRDEEDFELEVSSAGLSSPLRVVRQYQKNIGRNLDVLLNSGDKYQGKLLTANDELFILEVEEMIKPEGKKRKETVTRNIEFSYSDIKTAYIVVSFR